jgi:hypothetical protein
MSTRWFFDPVFISIDAVVAACYIALQSAIIVLYFSEDFFLENKLCKLLEAGFFKQRVPELRIRNCKKLGRVL